MSELKENGKEKTRKISVSIGGISYQLVSQENEAYTREIAHKADDAIRQIVSQHPSLSTTQSIILAVVNTMDALTKADALLEEAKSEVANVENSAAKEIEAMKFKMTKAQHELFSLRDSVFEMKKELMRISELNKQLELEIASIRQQQSPDAFKSRIFEIDPEDEMKDEPSDLTDEDGNGEEPAPMPSEMADFSDVSDSFLDEIADSFMISADYRDNVEQPDPDEAIEGYKQTSLEEYFA